jgi:glyoxylase-like metal-dependent hydrolase (beta-lactamase superfamily II)
VAQVGLDAADRARIIAHEQTLRRMSATGHGEHALPVDAWPTDTFFGDRRDLHFNGEAIELRHQPAAHTDGDIVVWFRKSDVVVAGDVYLTTIYPVVDLSQGAHVNGVIAALNQIIEITVPNPGAHLN